MHNVNLPVWILDYLPTAQLDVLLTAILFRNGSQELTRRHGRLAKGIHWRCALLAKGADALEARLAGYADCFSTPLVRERSHVLSTCHLLSKKLLKWREKDLLRILKRNVPILSLLTGIDTNGTND